MLSWDHRQVSSLLGDCPQGSPALSSCSLRVSPLLHSAPMHTARARTWGALHGRRISGRLVYTLVMWHSREPGHGRPVWVPLA